MERKIIDGALPHPTSTPPITPTTFRVPSRTVEAYACILADEFEQQVLRRGFRVIWDAPTNQALSRIASALVTPRPGKFGLLLMGGVGGGKTTAIKAVQALHSKMSYGKILPRQDDGRDFPLFWLRPAREIATLARDNPAEYNRIMLHPMLMIDDLGAEPHEVMSYGNAITPIAQLLEHRYASRLYTVASTNLTPDQLKEAYGTRVYDRLAEMMHVISYKNPSYRKMKKS